MKLIVQIPCLNEEKTLPETVGDIPREIPGVDRVEILVIDDGSTDRTSAVARELGVDHIVRHRTKRGLAAAFQTGIDACLKQGADIIVNTDGDNQYQGADIPKLIQPVLDGKADIVVGDRQTQSVAHFSGTKKKLQKFGSMVVRRASGAQIPDAVSGFRAYSRDAALSLNVLSTFSYTVETLIQAGVNRYAITHVPVRVNEKTRDSRLFKSIPEFLTQQMSTILRVFAMYHPLRVFAIIGIFLTVIGILPILRFLYFYMIGDGAGHIQSLIIAGVFIVLGFVTFVIALLSDLIAYNRKLLEITVEKLRRIELALQEKDDG
ncbi:MAG: glycosyltransferase family 2 protein [Magnetospiraceae bacterium]